MRSIQSHTKPYKAIQRPSSDDEQEEDEWTASRIQLLLSLLSLPFIHIFRVKLYYNSLVYILTFCCRILSLFSEAKREGSLEKPWLTHFYLCTSFLKSEEAQLFSHENISQEKKTEAKKVYNV